MSVEMLQQVEVVGYLLPLLAVTAQQVAAIFTRDNYQCIFPFEHKCVNLLAIHHIKGKRNDPNNLGTVCCVAHLNNLHNRRYTKEDKIIWETELRKIASEHTEEALANGWVFPIEPSA